MNVKLDSQLLRINKARSHTAFAQIYCVLPLQNMALELLTCHLPLHWLLLATAFAAFIYQFVLRTWWYFDQRNLNCYRGIPLLGSLYKSIISLDNEAEWTQKIYQKFPNEPFFGIYDMIGKPSILIRDPDLIKKVTITDFDHFVNHRFQFNENVDSLAGRTLFGMRDEKWRRMRSTMSPAFTSSKMKLMHGLIVETTHEFIETLRNDCGPGGKVHEARDLWRRYSNDIIGSCAFGIKINSILDSNNEFYKAGCEITNFEGLQGLKFFSYISIPAVMDFFKVKIISDRHSKFFRDVILNNMEQREKHGIVRNDMIDLLIKAKNGSLSQNDVDEETESKMGFATATGTNLKNKAANKLESMSEIVLPE